MRRLGGGSCRVLAWRRPQCRKGSTGGVVWSGGFDTRGEGETQVEGQGRVMGRDGSEPAVDLEWDGYVDLYVDRRERVR